MIGQIQELNYISVARAEKSPEDYYSILENTTALFLWCLNSYILKGRNLILNKVTTTTWQQTTQWESVFIP